MVYIGITNFYKSFVSHYMELGLRGAKLFRTVSNEYFVGLNEANFEYEKFKDQKIFVEELGSEVVNQQNFNKPHIRKWQFDEKNTENSTVFVIESEEDAEILERLKDSLSLEQLAKLVQLNDDEYEKSVYVLRDIGFKDFKIVAEKLRKSCNFETFYLHTEDFAYYPLNLSLVKSQEVNRDSIIYFDDELPFEIGELPSPEVEKVELEFTNLRSFKYDDELKIEQLLAENQEIVEGSVGTIIEVEKAKLTDALSEMTAKLQPDDEVVLFDFDAFSYIFVPDKKIYSEFESKFVDEQQDIVKQLNLSKFPSQAETDQKLDTDCYYLAKEIGEADYFHKFQLMKIDKTDGLQVSEIVENKRNFEVEFIDSVKTFETDSAFAEIISTIIQEYEQREVPVAQPEAVELSNTEPVEQKQEVPVLEAENEVKSVAYDDEILAEIKKEEPAELAEEADESADSLYRYYFKAQKSIDIEETWHKLLIEIINADNVDEIEESSEEITNLITNLVWYSKDISASIIKNMLSQIKPKLQGDKNHSADAIRTILDPTIKNEDKLDKIKNFNGLNYKLAVMQLGVFYKNNFSKIYIQRKLENLISLLNRTSVETVGKFTLPGLREYFGKNIEPNNIQRTDFDKLSTIIQEKLSDILKDAPTNILDNEAYVKTMSYLFINSNKMLDNSVKINKSSDKQSLLNDILSNREGDYKDKLKKLMTEINKDLKQNYYDESDTKMLEILLAKMESDSRTEELDITSIVASSKLYVLSKFVDKWVNILGENEYVSFCNKEIEKIIDSEEKYLTDNELRAIIAILDNIKKNRSSKDYKPEQMLMKLWDQVRVKETQYEILLESKNLDLSNLMIKRMKDTDFVLTHFLMWKESIDTTYHYYQVLYAKYLCNVGKINQAIDLLVKVYDRLEYLVKNRMLSSAGIPLHKVIAELIQVLPLSGKIRESNILLQKIQTLVKGNSSLFGKSTYSVEKVEIYAALIYYYSSIDIDRVAEDRIVNLMETILPLHQQGHAEHILFVFEKFWKAIIKYFPDLLNKLIGIFENIFENIKETSEFHEEYTQIFNLYKGFSQFINKQTESMPTIMFNESISELSGDSSQLLLFKKWLEIADDVNIMQYIDAEKFIETAYSLIIQTNSAIQGYNALLDFLSENVNKKQQNDTIEEKLIKIETSELKERIAELYSKLV